MANPPITIGPFDNVPAPGSAIVSAWAQQLTQYTVNLDAVVRQSFVAVTGAGGPGNVDATDQNVYATWLGIATFTPPAWATHADVDIAVLGVDVPSGDADYFLRPVLNANGQEFLHSGVIGKRHMIRAIGSFNVTPSVANSAVLQARRVGGIGFLRYTSGGAIVGTVRYRP